MRRSRTGKNEGGSKCVRAEQRKLRSVMTRVWRGVREAAFCVVGILPALRKPRRSAMRGEPSGFAEQSCGEFPREATAFDLRCFSHTRRLSISPIPFTPRQTPPFPQTAQPAHLRGAPHSASPNAAGGGVSRRPMPPRPRKGGAARRALLSCYAKLSA